MVEFVIFNVGGLMYMLVVLCDVCVELSVLLIEVYIFNVYVCEEFCCYFYFSFIVIGVIVGFGI